MIKLNRLYFLKYDIDTHYTGNTPSLMLTKRSEHYKPSLINSKRGRIVWVMGFILRAEIK